MFGRSSKSAGANLAALFNNASASSGIDNFANMLNNMGEQGGTKLGKLFNHLTSRGAENYAKFLNHANSDESQAVSAWIERASEGEILGLCEFLNKPPTSDPVKLKNAVVSFAQIRNEQKRTPEYDWVKSAVVGGRTNDVLRYLQDGFDVNSRNAHGEVMLLHAVCMGDARLPIARILIDRGADVNAIVNNKTMLEFIRDPVYCDNEETIALLIARGATERPPASSDADMIRFRCPQCNRRLKANQNAIGKKATCNKCGCKMTVPAAMAATTPPMDELAKALRDTLHDDFEVRIEALAKLRELKNLDAVEPLIRLLEDHDARIRQETAYTLESLGDSRAVMPLISAMRDLDGDVRLKVARALGVLKDNRAVETLCTHLLDPDHVVRFYAAQALGRIGDASALPALRSALEQTTHEGAHREMESAIKSLQPATLVTPPPLPPPALTGREAAKRLNDMSNVADQSLAEDNLRAAINADPNWPIPYCNLGKLCFHQGRTDESRQLFLRAYQLASSQLNRGDQLVLQESEYHLRMLGLRTF
jgi:tetratricopeptide (TPR) repeat protein